MYLLICGFQSFPSIFISTLIISTFHLGLWIISNTSLMFFKGNDFFFLLDTGSHVTLDLQ